MLPLLQTKDPHVNLTPNELNTLSSQLRMKQKAKIIELTQANSQLNGRNEAFQPKFSQLKRCLGSLAGYCRPKWGVYLELIGEDDFLLDKPIRLVVDDPVLDRVYRNTVTLNHGIAAVILQLAINITIGSQFIIIDGVDEFVEPCLVT